MSVEPAGQPQQLAAAMRRPQPGGARGDRRRAARRIAARPRSPRARWRGCRGRAAASRDAMSPAGVRTIRAAMPSRPRSSTSSRAHVGGVLDPERHDTCRQRRRPARRCGRRRRWPPARRRARVLQDFTLGVGNRVGRGEEADVRVADVGPHADLRFGDVDERSDFSGMIHAELDHCHFGSRPQLEERERQADVVVQVSLVAKHPVPRRQKLRRDFLGRRLSCAAGDRHDLRSGSPPHVARDVLQCRASCPPRR